MTTITFTYAARLLKSGLHSVHLYIRQNDPDWGDTPRGERLAIRDAAQIVHDIVGENTRKPGDRLLRSGEPPEDSFPVFTFTIGISWNRAARCAHYSRVCYQRHVADGKWNPVAALGMEQYDYTMSVLRKREKLEVKSRRPSPSRCGHS